MDLPQFHLGIGTSSVGFPSLFLFLYLTFIIKKVYSCLFHFCCLEFVHCSVWLCFATTLYLTHYFAK
jgi:hypothetical protein